MPPARFEHRFIYEAGTGSNGSYEISVTADKKWLDAEERQYPVRIDPPPQFRQMSLSLGNGITGQPNAIYLTGDGNAYVGYVDSNLKNCRQYVAFNENDCESITSMPQELRNARSAAVRYLPSQPGPTTAAMQMYLPSVRPPWADAHKINLEWSSALYRDRNQAVSQRRARTWLWT